MPDATSFRSELDTVLTSRDKVAQQQDAGKWVASVEPAGDEVTEGETADEEKAVDDTDDDEVLQLSMMEGGVVPVPCWRLPSGLSDSNSRYWPACA